MRIPKASIVLLQNSEPALSTDFASMTSLVCKSHQRYIPSGRLISKPKPELPPVIRATYKAMGTSISSSGSASMFAVHTPMTLSNLVFKYVVPKGRGSGRWQAHGKSHILHPQKHIIRRYNIDFDSVAYEHKL